MIWQTLALLGFLASASAQYTITKSMDHLPPEMKTFDAGCTEDNWGLPNQKKKPYKTTYKEDIKDKCEGRWKVAPFSTKRQAMVSYYKDTPDFNKFIATDHVPENKHLYKPGAQWGKRYDYTSVEKYSMKIAECEIDTGDGGGWILQRIGPFKSTGGYDWWQIGWDDVWNLEGLLAKHKEGVYITEQLSAPVDKDGNIVGHPPIHVHHVHITPIPGVRQRTDPFQCVIDGTDCYDPTRVGEHHGDYECHPEEGGVDCMYETFPDGYGKLITYPLGLESDFNDVRAPGSEVLEWYYTLGARWVPKESEAGAMIRPMSFHNFAGPGDYYLTDQLTYIFTYQCPTTHDSIFWYTGRMRRAAKLLRLKIHAHNTIFAGALFISGSPDQAGLTKSAGLVPPQPKLTVDIKKAGFESLHDVKKHIYNSLDIAAATARSKGEKEPFVVCQSLPDIVVDQEGYPYDRRPPTCCRDWEMEKDEIVTIIGFNTHVGMLPGPHADKIPPTIPGHIGWWLSYDTEEEPPRSHYSFALYNNNPDGQLDDALKMTPLQKMALVVQGGVYNDFRPGKTPHAFLSSLGLMVVNVAFTWTGKLVALTLFGLIFYAVYSRSRRNKAKKTVVEIDVPTHQPVQNDIEKSCPEAVVDSVVAVPRAVADQVKKARDEIERQQRIATKAD